MKIPKLNKLQKIFVVAIICLLVSTITVYALTTWTHTFTWTVTNRSFEVYTDASYTTKWNDELTDFLGTDLATEVQIFYFNNSGNVPVKISASDIMLLGASVSWDTRSITLTNTGDHGTMTLTINSFTETGSYQFQFTASAPP
jgi:hypothetical protein